MCNCEVCKRIEWIKAGKNPFFSKVALPVLFPDLNEKMKNSTNSRRMTTCHPSIFYFTFSHFAHQLLIFLTNTKTLSQVLAKSELLSRA